MCNPIEPANPAFRLPCANEESPTNVISKPLPSPVSPPPLEASIGLADKCVTQKTVPPLFPSIFPVSNLEEKAPPPSAEELSLAAAQPQQALKGNHQSKLEELKGKVNPDTLKSFISYLTNKEIPLINNENAIDLLLLSKEHGESSLYMQCLKHTLNSEHSNLGQVDRHSNSQEQNNILSLLIEAKQNEMTISEGAGGTACIKMDGDKETQWKCLTKLHAFMLITHLKCRKTKNLGFLLPFLQSNKNLIHLNMGASTKIGDKELEKIALHLPALKSFSIKNAKITQVPESISLHVKYLDCSYCTKLTALNVPVATMASCSGCKALTILHAPLATSVHCNDCKALTILHAPVAARVMCSDCSALVTFHAPLATMVNCAGCKALTTLNVPGATEVDCHSCKALTTLHAPLATSVHCNDCKNLPSLHAPLATIVNCADCKALTTLDFPLAATVDCHSCKALTTLNAPVATMVNCSICNLLTTLDAPLATNVDCSICNSLNTLNAPLATNVDCMHCSSLTALNAPLAATVDCKFCASLTSLNAPVATTVNCYFCNSLTTLNAPLAATVDCVYCLSLTTLHVPKALSIGRHCEFPAMTTEARLKTFTSLRKNIYMSYYANASDPDFFEHLSNAGTLIPDQQSLLDHERSFGDWHLKAGALVTPAFFGSDAEELRVKRKIKTCLRKLFILACDKGVEEQDLKWFKDLKKLNSPQQQMKRIIWLGALLACSAPGKNPLVDPHALSTLCVISNLTNPLLQREMTRILLSMYEEETLKAATWTGINKKAAHLILPCLVLSKAQLVKEDINDLLKSLQPAYYKDRAILTPILEMISLLVLQNESHEQLLKLLIKAPERKKREKNGAFKERLTQHRKGQAQLVMATLDLLLFKKGHALLDIANGDDLLEKHKVICQDFFGIKKELAPQFSETFTSKRYPNALPTYAARLQTLRESEKALVIKVLGTFVNAHLEGSFPDIRYDLAVNPHLDQIFRDKPALLVKWKAPLEIDLSDEIVPQSPPVDAHAIIKHKMANAIADHHLGVDQDAMYPTLVKILPTGNSGDIATSLTALQEELDTLGGSLDVKKRDCLAIEIACLKALDPRTEAAARIDILRSLSTKLSASPDFKNDVLGMLKAIRPSKTMRLQKIESTDSWEDLILMGTEVNNSCQSIEGNPNLNKCLLAYILDGKNKPIIVRDAEGKIAARSILRILWNEEQQCPVLFMERVYTRTSDPSLPDLIRRGCEKKAAEMGLSLVATPQDFPTATPYNGTLLALGGPAPFEYVDALFGIKENGVFAISDSHLLYKPGIIFSGRPR